MSNLLKTILGVAVPVVFSTVFGLIEKSANEKKMKDAIAEEVSKQLSQNK